MNPALSGLVLIAFLQIRRDGQFLDVCRRVPGARVLRRLDHRKASRRHQPGSQQSFTIRWPSVAGKRYEVERSVTLFGGSWSPVSTKDGTGLEMQFQDGDSIGNIQYFYRVRVAE